MSLNRRTFLQSSAITAASAFAGLGAPWSARAFADAAAVSPAAIPLPAHRPDYTGPNIIVIRFGGGVRRLETIDTDHTYAPFFRHELAARGTLLTHLRIDSRPGVNTGHGEGTLNILTGRYDSYKDVTGALIGERFEAKVPTLFEYLRKAFDVPAHQALILNNENRTQEEFYSFSNHHLFGVNYRSDVLSLYRYKLYILREQIKAGVYTGNALIQKQQQLNKLERLDYRQPEAAINGQGDAIDNFWAAWRRDYRDNGLVNPRGDRLLTELAVRAMAQLQPRFMMINYTDPDYVHWGNIHHYTRAISIIDQSMKRLVTAVEADERYRDNTLFVIVPDCGRDSNRYMAVPCQHHFNSPSAHEIFALFVGPGVDRGVVCDHPLDQIEVAPTVAKLMGTTASHAEGHIIDEVFA